MEEQFSTPEARLLGQMLSGVRGDVSDVKDQIERMAQTLHALAGLEIQHQETRKALERSFTSIERVDHRVDDLDRRQQVVEVAMPGLKEARLWVIAMAGGAVSIILIALAALVINPVRVMPAASAASSAAR